MAHIARYYVGVSHIYRSRSKKRAFWRSAGVIAMAGWVIAVTSCSGVRLPGNMLASQRANEPWAMYRHDRTHTGRSSLPGPAAYREKWHLDGLGGSPPAVAASGTLYVQQTEGPLCAIDSSGKVLWRLSSVRPATRASPAIGRDGTIYIGPARGVGKTPTPEELSGLIGQPIPQDATTSALLNPLRAVVGRMIAVTPGGRLKWSSHAIDVAFSSPTVAEDGTIYVAGAMRTLYALGSDGETKWVFATGLRPDAIGDSGGELSSPALGRDGTVYVGGLDGNLHAVTPSGKERWRLPAGGALVTSPVVGTDGTVYAACADGALRAVTTFGRVRWTFDTRGYGALTPALGADGTVYVTGGDGTLYAVGTDGKARWTFVPPPRRSARCTGLAVAREAVYCGTTHGQVVALSLSQAARCGLVQQRRCPAREQRRPGR